MVVSIQSSRGQARAFSHRLQRAQKTQRSRARDPMPQRSLHRAYVCVVERIAAELSQRKFKLLEALAEHVCAIVTNEFKAPWVRLSVAKLGHIRNVRKVGVVLERRRDPGE